MDFAVRRLTTGAPDAPNYHLLNGEGELLVVADQAVPPDSDGRRQVRLARPDGKLLATIDLPYTAEADGREDYAIIHDYAVYAILSVYRTAPVLEGDPSVPTFVVEVEGGRWLVIPDDEMDHCYAIYDEVPGGLFAYDNLAELDLPPCVGRICALNNDLAFSATLAPGLVRESRLVILALAFLVDSTHAL